MSYIQDVGFDFQLPILPAEVDYIELRWTSTEQVGSMPTGSNPVIGSVASTGPRSRVVFPRDNLSQ